MNYLYVNYPKCSTCKKAKTWLDDNNITYTHKHMLDEHPTETELREWHKKSGLPLKKFFNTSGLLYRSLELSKKLPFMNEDEQFEILADHGMLVKRPIVIGDNIVLVGFKPDQWERLKQLK